MDPLERLRRLCLALPGTSERTSHGERAFFAGSTEKSSKMFVVSDQHHHHSPRLGFWCAAPAGVQAEMIDEDPDRFYRPPYVGTRGWLGVHLDGCPDWDEVAVIVCEAFRCVVPAALAAQLPSSPAYPRRSWTSLPN